MPRFDSKHDKVSEFLNSTGDSVNPQQQKNIVFELINKVFSGYQSSPNLLQSNLLKELEPIWYTEIAPVLISKFGRETKLYVIFYIGITLDEVIMEVWDPKYVNTQSAQMFKLRVSRIPEHEIKNFPKQRAQATILILENWS